MQSEITRPARYEVIIPAWNAADTIGDTIDSVLAQTCHPSRITVVDDGSQDSTVAISVDKGIEVISRPHLGLIAVRNFCVQIAQEPLFCMLDSDDHWLPHMAECQLSHWQDSSAEVAAIGACAEPFGDELSGWIVRGQPVAAISEISPVDAWDRNPLTASLTFFRTEAVRSVGGWKADVPKCEDYDLLLRLLASGWQLRRINRVCGRYRVRPHSWGADTSGFLESEMCALRRFSITLPTKFHPGNKAHQKRIRALWWRIIARAAHYGHDISKVPPPPMESKPTPQMWLMQWILQSKRIGGLVTRSWTFYRKWVPRHAKSH